MIFYFTSVWIHVEGFLDLLEYIPRLHQSKSHKFALSNSPEQFFSLQSYHAARLLSAVVGSILSAIRHMFSK
jgi:hypothetical protein